MPVACLENRTLIRLSGPDAAHFLHNLVTTDVAGLPAGEAWPGALLSPQGKILFAFLVARDGEDFVIETDSDQGPALAKRLTLYKLRAKVEMTVSQADVTVGWDEAAPAAALADHRFAVAGRALWRLHGASSAGDESAYHEYRTGLGLAEAGIDYPLGEAYPHDVLFDRTGGVSFRKGCYVGQEVVSRMQHRSTARRRIVIVKADHPLAEGAGLIADGREAGKLGRPSGMLALSIARIDRIGASLAAGAPVTVEDRPVTVSLPAWAGLDFPAGETEAEA